MHAQEVMNRFFVVLNPGDTLQRAARAMADEGVGMVCVCDEARRPVGVVTDRDIVTRACAKGLHVDVTSVEQVMTSPPLFCQLGAPMGEVEDTMKREGVSRMLVVSEADALVGVITLGDIWHYENAFAAGAVSRRMGEREFRMSVTGGLPSALWPKEETPTS